MGWNVGQQQRYQAPIQHPWMPSVAPPVVNPAPQYGNSGQQQSVNVNKNDSVEIETGPNTNRSKPLGILDARGPAPFRIRTPGLRPSGGAARPPRFGGQQPRARFIPPGNQNISRFKPPENLQRSKETMPESMT